MSISELTAPTATQRRPTLPAGLGADGCRDHVHEPVPRGRRADAAAGGLPGAVGVPGRAAHVAFAVYAVGFLAAAPHAGVALRPHRPAPGADRRARRPARVEPHVPRRPRHRMGDRRPHRAGRRQRRGDDGVHRRARRTRPAEPEAAGHDPRQRRPDRRTRPRLLARRRSRSSSRPAANTIVFVVLTIVTILGIVVIALSPESVTRSARCASLADPARRHPARRPHGVRRRRARGRRGLDARRPLRRPRPEHGPQRLPPRQRPAQRPHRFRRAGDVGRHRLAFARVDRQAGDDHRHLRIHRRGRSSSSAACSSGAWQS